jgi:hypothetical protein
MVASRDSQRRAAAIIASRGAAVTARSTKGDRVDSRGYSSDRAGGDSGGVEPSGSARTRRAAREGEWVARSARSARSAVECVGGAYGFGIFAPPW